MARKSQRLSSNSAPRSSHKRAISSSEASAAAMKRSKATKSTPTKSQYFTGDDDEAEMEVAENSEIGASEFDDDDAVSSLSDLADGSHDEDFDDDEPKQRKKITSHVKPLQAKTGVAKGSELLKAGVKTGLGPGTQVIIKKPKARPAGKMPYRDDAIHPNTLLFLQDLKANNNRQWLKSKFHFRS